MIGWAREILLDPRSAPARLDAHRAKCARCCSSTKTARAITPSGSGRSCASSCGRGAHVDRAQAASTARMRVTMLVRCLAMMRGGGETRHLAWARELTALGVDVDDHHRRAAALRRARAIRSTASTATVLRSPYARDFVYRFQNRRGFGRLTMAALHARRGVVLPRRVAAHRRAPRSGPTSFTRTRCTRRRACARRHAGRDQPAGPAESALHRRSAAGRRAGRRRLGRGASAGDARPAGRAVPKGVDAELFPSRRADLRAALGLDGKRVVLTVARLVPIKNVRAAASTRWRSSATRDPRRAPA